MLLEVMALLFVFVAIASSIWQQIAPNPKIASPGSNPKIRLSPFTFFPYPYPIPAQAG